MSMLCAISGEVPAQPVASAKSGTVFEKRLIEDYISEHGKDPVTGEELSTADLIELKSSPIVRPRPPTLTSIPALLATFQNEWDALALETHALRQQLAQVRQELSTALYQHDAATRVIARLLKERDEAREALSHVTVAGGASSANGEQMEVDAPQVPNYIQEKVDATKAELSAGRKNRPVPAGWSVGETVSSFEVLSTSEPLYPGTRSLSLDATGDLALFGGADGIAGVYSVSKEQLLHPLKAQDGAINDVAWAGARAATASSSGIVRFWNETGNDSVPVRAHGGEAVGLTVHPSRSIVASVGTDKSWVMYDVEATKSVVQIYDSSSTFTTAQFHPDGHLLAVGTDTSVKVYDVRSASLGATLEPLSNVSSLCFSENGYWLAVAQKETTAVEIWDLRKVKATKSLDAGGRVDHLSWDYSGQFLATSGSGGISVQQFVKEGKKWTEPLRTAIASAACAWGPQASRLVSVSSEGVVSVLGARG